MPSVPIDAQGLLHHGEFYRRHWELVEAAYRRGLVQGRRNHAVVLADLADPVARHVAERFGLTAGEIRRKRHEAYQRGTEPVWVSPFDIEEARVVLEQLELRAPRDLMTGCRASSSRSWSPTVTASASPA